MQDLDGHRRNSLGSRSSAALICLCVAAMTVIQSGLASAAPALPCSDSLQNAVAQLTAKGFAPPPGFTVVEVEPGEIGGSPGRWEFDIETGTGEIQIDVGLVQDLLGDVADETPVALSGAFSIILIHEYLHDPSNGGPGDADYCEHALIFSKGYNWFIDNCLCDVEPWSDRVGLCLLVQSLGDKTYDAREANLKCGGKIGWTGPLSNIKLPPCCEV